MMLKCLRVQNTRLSKLPILTLQQKRFNSYKWKYDVDFFHGYHPYLHQKPVLNVNAAGTIQKVNGSRGKIIYINNPYETNRFDVDMSETLMEEMMKQNANPIAKVIVLTGTGSRAFSGGVDVRAVYKYALQKRYDECARLYREYYKTGFYIANCGTPIVTLVNGMMTSSGALVAAYADYACLAPNASWACPETAIGGCPDGGNTFLCGQISKKYPGLGMFLGLTGARVMNEDLIALGILTHKSFHTAGFSLLDRLDSHLEQHTDQTIDICVQHILDPIDRSKLVPSFAKDLPAIERCFHNKKSVEEIIECLKEENTTFAKRTLDALNRCSPIALKVAHRALTYGEKQSLSTCINMEYRINMRQIKSKDWLEGMRARYIYGDPAGPNWSVKRLEDVTEEMVDEYFESPTWKRDMTCDLYVADEAFWFKQIDMIIERNPHLIHTKPKEDKNLPPPEFKGMEGYEFKM